MEAADLKQGDIDAANTAAKEAKERTDELVAELEARAARHLSEMGGLREERSPACGKSRGQPVGSIRKTPQEKAR